ncbi:MAG: hypothetical protein A2Y67_04455 [Candidatus Buchananbacteria bacterium RBG_13_39_9]|uniref:Uncharacterized protein n=1 Tax=Candidatus Buchananbacteria bacterium RBG_13_39_9 TaxID=1797531 RepID=A0A1G1XQ92_9BACT|nr:MAG: hypothetical protein A2Y67_04455 [Candidatus Buchananbacteria bacterium RBG_13_39_9]
MLYYLGARGFILLLSFIILPFALEYLLFKLKIPFFQEAVIRSLTFRNLDLPINLSTLFSVFSLPLIFCSALIFAQKVKLFISVKKYFKTVLIICSSLLIALSFFAVTQNAIEYQNSIKWLIIALSVNFLVSAFFIFKVNVQEIYKELPIILFLALYNFGGLKRLDVYSLFIGLFLIIFYLLILYNEYKLRKLSQNL